MDDYEQLREGWGNMKGGIQALSKAMGRSVDALKIKANKLKLGPWLDASEYVTLNQLFLAVSGPETSVAYCYTRWKRLGLPLVKRTGIACKWEMVRIRDFWNWAKQNQNELDFSRFDENALGLEPTWAKEKRNRDRQNRRLVLPKKTPWSHHEDALLKLKCEHGATWDEIENAFQRSGGAIRRRIYDLNLQKRVRSTSWSSEDLEKLLQMREAGYSIDYIAKVLVRTSHSIRGKLHSLEMEQ